MFNEIVKEINWGGSTLTLKTGKVARQADGAVMVSMGDTVVMCTVVAAKKVKDGMTFFPLTVHYREMYAAAGKIPGGYMKSEGRSSNREILVCRLIDRPIRPLFHPAFFNETQIICTVLSYDPAHNPDILAMVGSSAALAVAGLPFMDVIGAARVGHIDGELVLNPSIEATKSSRLDLVVAGTDSSVMMVESEADQLSEEEMLAAVEFGHNAFQPVIKAINELAKEAGKSKWALPEPIASTELIDDIKTRYSKDITEAFKIHSKLERYAALDTIRASIDAAFAEFHGAEPVYSPLQIDIAFDEAKSSVLRADVLKSGIRIDGRKTTDIRAIEAEAAFLPRAHGSSLFTRGETQAIVSTTLGTTQDGQIVDSISGDGRETFMLQYIFPPYSVGEHTPLRAPGRREVGHGKLAWRALNPVLPSQAEFPYTLRVVSEITESNGSSSMATVCGGSLSMMDAGVPLKAPVSGIAMGLIKEGDKFVVLSDILGDEDHLGDMDFKVAGTANGVTALQMDIKVTGITFEIMKQALAQANDGRAHILGIMNKVLAEHRTELSGNAPTIKTFKINKDKIREVIGSGGKVIKDICEKTGAKVDISDDGTVQVAAVGAESLNAAIGMIQAIASDPEFGQIFDGTVAKVLESGAFINYMPGKDGFIHISEVAEERVEILSDHLKEGQAVKVKIIGIDPKGKAKLSMKIEFDHKPDDRGPRPSFGDRPRRDDSRGSDRPRNDRPKNDDRGDRGDKGGERSERPRRDDRESGGNREEKSDRGGERSGRKPAPAAATERKYFN